MQVGASNYLAEVFVRDNRSRGNGCSSPVGEWEQAASNANRWTSSQPEVREAGLSSIGASPLVAVLRTPQCADLLACDALG
jgi:hypothetical protein